MSSSEIQVSTPVDEGEKRREERRGVQREKNKLEAEGKEIEMRRRSGSKDKGRDAVALKLSQQLSR